MECDVRLPGLQVDGADHFEPERAVGGNSPYDGRTVLEAGRKPTLGHAAGERGVDHATTHRRFQAID